MTRSICLLCSIELLPTDLGHQIHPEVDDCDVRFTNEWGIAIDEPVIHQDPEPIDVKLYPLTDEVMLTVFDRAGVPRLGGKSTGRGWSNFSVFQRCPYAWYRKHVVKAPPVFWFEPPALAIGTLIHTFLAVHYMKMIDESYPLTPEMVRDQALLIGNPEFINEAWRVFYAYRVFYMGDKFIPLAVEYDLVDPRNNESCRYDLIAYLQTASVNFPAGTYIVEHKSASRFDNDTLDGWAIDGEILGEASLWRELGLDRRFGKLQGVLVNLLGKHKEPRFHRTLVSPSSLQIDQHLDDLRNWEGLIQLARGSRNFPRARNGCIGRYGRCSEWDHCAGVS